MASNQPHLDDVISLRSKTVPNFAGFFPSLYRWNEYGGYFISHPTPIDHNPALELRGPYMRACHEWKEDLQKATEAGIVYQLDVKEGRWKAGDMEMERSKWRWNEFTSKSLVEHGFPADLPGYVL
jgi:hypothetical protein